MFLIPDRQSSAVTGSQFCQNNLSNKVSERETNILTEFLAGNIPSFLRNFCEVKVTNGNNTIVYLTMPDYLSIGSDDDYVRMPMNPLTAQKIANQYNCTLPTKKIVDDIWKQADNKLPALPNGPPYDSSMLSTDRFIKQNNKINAQMVNKDKSKLTAGHKKDVVLTNKLAPNNPNHRVAIYGWFNSDGSVIQGPVPNASSHEDSYLDYSHGLRMIARDVMVNDNAMDISDVFSNAEYCKLISDEGILNFKSY